MEYEPQRPVYLPVVDLLQLELHLGVTRPGMKLEAFLMELVRSWMANESDSKEPRIDGPALRGFQWKTLFLPDGTILRTTHGETAEFAKVSGEHIVSEDGTKWTPSLFANRRTKGRNAWRFIWLRFPGDEAWIRADDCRARHDGRSLKQSKDLSQQSKTV